MSGEIGRFAIGWLSASALATALACLYAGMIGFVFVTALTGLSGDDAPRNFFQLLAANPIPSLLFALRLGALIAVLLLCGFLPAAWISRRLPRYALPTFVIAGAIAGSALAPSDFFISKTGSVYFDYMLTSIGALAGFLGGWIFRKLPKSRTEAIGR